MKLLYLLFFLIVIPISFAHAQAKVGEPQDQTVDSVAVPQLVIAMLHRVVPEGKDVSWQHYYCQQCPKDGTYSFYKAEFYQGTRLSNLTIDEKGVVIASRLYAKLGDMPIPVQQEITERAKKMQQDFQGVETEMSSFTEGNKVLYNIVFYIPTEDKKHWTPYDEVNLNAKGSPVRIKEE